MSSSSHMSSPTFEIVFGTWDKIIYKTQYDINTFSPTQESSTSTDIGLFTKAPSFTQIKDPFRFMKKHRQFQTKFLIGGGNPVYYLETQPNLQPSATQRIPSPESQARSITVFQDEYAVFTGHCHLAFVTSLDLNSFGVEWAIPGTGYCSASYRNYVIIGCSDYSTYVYDMPKVFALARKESKVYSDMLSKVPTGKTISHEEMIGNGCVAHKLSDHKDYVFSMTTLRDYLITGSYDNSIIVYDMANGFKKLKRFFINQNVYYLNGIPGVHDLICAGLYNGVTSLFKLDDVLRYAPDDGEGSSGDWNAKHKEFVDKYTAHTIIIPNGNGTILGIDYHYKQELVAAAGGDSQIAIYSLKEKKMLGIINHHLSKKLTGWIGFVHFIQDFGNMGTLFSTKSLRHYSDLKFEYK